MKKAVLCLLVFVMLLASCFAYAEDGAAPILFRGAEWGSTFDEAIKVLPEGSKVRDLNTTEYWYSVDNLLYNESVWDDSYKGELGGYTYVQSSSLKGLQVAGYDIEELKMYFVYTTGDDGLLIKDSDHTAFIYAYYKLEPKDPDAAYEDLLTKLTKLYGDVDVRQTDSSYIVYEQNLWDGGNGTKVSLLREDYPTGSHYIYIKYSFDGANDLMKKAYDALVLEESVNASSNVEGL